MANCIAANHTIYIARRSLRDCPAFAACFSSIAAQAISESETHNSGSTQYLEINPSTERESRLPLPRTNAHSSIKKEFMKSHTPKLVYYGQMYEQAFDIICRRKLLGCEPARQPIDGLLFQDENDLIACALVFSESVEIEGNLVIMPSSLRCEVEGLVEQLSMEDRVESVELLGVWFWDSDDERASNEELDAL
jgi:hypothetical protein